MLRERKYSLVNQPAGMLTFHLGYGPHWEHGMLMITKSVYTAQLHWSLEANSTWLWLQIAGRQAIVLQLHWVLGQATEEGSRAGQRR